MRIVYCPNCDKTVTVNPDDGICPSCGKELAKKKPARMLIKIK